MGVLHDDRGHRFRCRRLRRGGVVWQASDGSDDQPEEVVEGFAGSLVCGITATIITATFLVGKTPWIGALLGVLFVLTTALGDLVESQVKRDLGIKDMGRLLPGHGGLMDRLDGILPSAVAAWIVLTLLP